MMQLKGFSLLEVLVALAIMVVSFTALLGTQSGQLMLSERGEYMTSAVMLARQKLSEIEINYRYGSLPSNDFDELKKIEDKPFGDDFEGYGYQLIVRKVRIPIPSGLLAAQGGDTAVAQSAETISVFLSQAMREVRLKVFWESPLGEDQIEIVTHLVDLNANFGL